MSRQQTIKIEDNHFRAYYHEIKVSPQLCEKKHEDKDAANKAYRKGPYDGKYYKTSVQEGSKHGVAVARIKLADDFPRKWKLEPELKLFTSYPVLVGCTACYKYMMVSSRKCLLCNRRAYTVEELASK